MNGRTIDPRSEIVLSEEAKEALAKRFGGKLPTTAELAGRYGAASVRGMTREKKVDRLSTPRQSEIDLSSPYPGIEYQIPPEVAAQVEAGRRNETVARAFFHGSPSSGQGIYLSELPKFSSKPKQSIDWPRMVANGSEVASAVLAPAKGDPVDRSPSYGLQTTLAELPRFSAAPAKKVAWDKLADNGVTESTGSKLTLPWGSITGKKSMAKAQAGLLGLKRLEK